MLISKHVNMYIAICVNLICASGLVFNHVNFLLDVFFSSISSEL